MSESLEGADAANAAPGERSELSGLVDRDFAVYVRGRFDLDILADPFFSIENHEAIISIVQRGEVEDIVEHILADTLAEEDIVTFLDGDDHVFGNRVKRGQAKFQVLVLHFVEADLQMQHVGGVQHRFDVRIYGDLMMITLGGSSVSGDRER